MSDAHRWVPYIVGGKPSLSVKQATDQASGAYAIRRKDSRGVVYVGESNLGHMWRTLARHFQAPVTFTATKKPGGANAFATDAPGDYEVTWQITSRGKRAKKSGDQKAMALQARWIRKFRKAGNRLHNRDDGMSSAQWLAKEKKEAKSKARGDDDFAFGANAPRSWYENPRGPLTALGRLTRIGYGKGGRAWALASSPWLAYDEAGRLHVFYAGKVDRGATPVEVTEYKRTHWGAEPAGKVRGGGVAPGPWTELGPGTSITYTTRKGEDSDLVDYVHAWGEGGRRKFTAPVVVEHACKGGCRTTCAARGAIALSGGSYAVSSRGIVG